MIGYTRAQMPERIPKSRGTDLAESQVAVATHNPQKAPRFIARHLVLGFGAISVVAIAMCAMLLNTISSVSGLVSGMQGHESSIRSGLELATSVREQSIHIAHTAIEGDLSHVKHYEEWRATTREKITELSRVVSAERMGTVRSVESSTRRLDELFQKDLLPAVQRQDAASVKRIHRELEELGEEASAEADALAQLAEGKMSHAHVLATATTREGLLTGAICIALILLLATGFTLHMRAVVVRPINQLTVAALQFGQGSFETRVGNVGKGELAELAFAFDRMADELKARQRRIVQQERMAAIGQLAAGVAHELNNPIGIIRGYLKTMSPQDEPEELAQELGILDEEAAQCQRIAEDLLSYARSPDLQREPIELSQFLPDVLSRFEVANEKVSCDVEPAIVSGDPARLRQVVFNLVANAQQAASSVGSVTVRGSVNGSDYFIEVTDDGPGIPNSEKGHVFEPFFSKRRGGSGLGLAVVQGIIRAHGGTISIQDVPEGGSRFQVRLPLSDPTAVSEGS